MKGIFYIKKSFYKECDHDEINLIIENGLNSKKLTYKDLAVNLRITERTIANRKKNPNNWTRKQLIEISKILSLNDEDILKLVKIV